MSFGVKLSEHPQLRAMLKVLGYRRHTARIVYASRCELNGRYWDGGSRSTYTVVDIVPMKFTRIPHCAPPQFGGPSEDIFHDILPGQCVVSHGTFCGKQSHAAVYIGEADYKRWFGNPLVDILQTAREIDAERLTREGLAP